MYDLTMDRGWAYVAQAIEMDGWLQFSGMRRSGKGYIGQEAELLMEQVRNVKHGQ